MDSADTYEGGAHPERTASRSGQACDEDRPGKSKRRRKEGKGERIEGKAHVPRIPETLTQACGIPRPMPFVALGA